jgi:ABC-type phosphate transport system substrate-binding protein
MIINRYLMIGVLIYGLTTQSVIAHADLVVIVNPHVSFNALTKGELRRIFLGQTSKFPNGQPAIPFDVAGDYRNRFYQDILVKTPESVENYWANTIFTGKAQPPRQVQPNEAKQLVAASPRAISYIDRSQVDASVKVINILNGK